ncbi:hypothetical protein Tco_0619929, partial [Tanacetum coccineum]
VLQDGLTIGIPCEDDRFSIETVSIKYEWKPPVVTYNMVNSPNQDNITSSNSFAALNKDIEDEEEVENVFDEMANLFNSKTGGRSSFTAVVVCACARYQVNPKIDIMAVQETDSGCKFHEQKRVPQLSGPTTHVADEAVHKQLGDNLVRAATTASSLEREHGSGNITKTRSKATPNESCSLGTNSGGGPKWQETMGDTIAQTRFENVSKLFYDSLLARYKDITLVNDDADKEMFDVDGFTCEKDKGKGTLVEPNKPLKKKDQLNLDEEIALKLQAEINEEGQIARAEEEIIDELNIALTRRKGCMQAILRC